MEHVDFEIRIRSEGRRGFQCEALISAVPARPVRFKPPLSPEEIARFFDPPEGEAPCCPAKVGEALYNALFRGATAEAFRTSVAFVEGQGRKVGIRLWLRFPEDPALVPVAALPWELLRRPETRDFLGRMRRSSILRFLETSRLFPPPKVDSELRVLVVRSAPWDRFALDLESEWEAIRSRLKNPFHVEVLDHPTTRTFREKLLSRDWHVVHFMGHGTFLEERGESILYFENEGGSERVTATAFAENLKDLDSLRLVVLNACGSGALPRRLGQDPFSSAAPALLLAGIPAVIAMQIPVCDGAALAFSEAFYGRLAEGDPVDTAVSEGRLAIYTQDNESLEWAAPVLFLGTRERKLFELRSAGPAAAPPKPEARGPLRLGIRSFGGPESIARNLESQTDRLLKLEGFFGGPEGRNILGDHLWQAEIYPRVRDFLTEAANEREPVVLDLATHASIAFMAGYCLGTRSGLDVAVRQRYMSEIRELRGESTPLPEEPLWSDEADRPRSPEARDVALAVGIRHPVLSDAECFLERSGLAVSRILTATIAPRPDHGVVRDGAHALHLAQSLSWKIRSRTLAEREGVLHVFASAPNSVLFFLGQLCRGVGRIQFYEFDFHLAAPGAYRPSIRLPVEK